MVCVAGRSPPDLRACCCCGPRCPGPGLRPAGTAACAACGLEGACSPPPGMGPCGAGGRAGAAVCGRQQAGATATWHKRLQHITGSLGVQGRWAVLAARRQVQLAALHWAAPAALGTMRGVIALGLGVMCSAWLVLCMPPRYSEGGRVFRPPRVLRHHGCRVCFASSAEPLAPPPISFRDATCRPALP